MLESIHSAQATTSTSTNQSGETRPATNMVVMAGRTPSNISLRTSTKESISSRRVRKKDILTMSDNSISARTQDGLYIQDRLLALATKILG